MRYFELDFQPPTIGTKVVSRIPEGGHDVTQRGTVVSRGAGQHAANLTPQQQLAAVTGQVASGTHARRTWGKRLTRVLATLKIQQGSEGELRVEQVPVAQSSGTGTWV